MKTEVAYIKLYYKMINYLSNCISEMPSCRCDSQANHYEI